MWLGMSEESTVQMFEPSSLEDYIALIDSRLAENDSHLLFFSYSFDQLRGEEKIVRDATMYNMLLQFKETGLMERKVEYPIFLNEIIEDMSYMILTNISEGMDNMEKMGEIASSEPRNIPSNAISIGKVSGEGADLLRKIEVMAYAVRGYKVIREGISNPTMIDSRPKYN